jgi:autotransporter family porin
MTTWYTAGADTPAYRGRVNGHFTGTTDEIIQWASCKWGFPTDLNRAQAVAESTWQQSFVGDGGESYGLYQMRRGVWGAYPNSSASTAFNADWAMGLRRACYDGVMWYAELRGDLEACIGVHFSGDPAESTWRAYTDAVLEYERTKPWLEWSSATGIPPTATRGG